MFTGLVESIGRVASIDMATDSAVFTFESVPFADSLSIGDSVSVNGTCLTVTKFDSNSFSVDVMTQTLKLTSLQNLEKGDAVNLERAALVSSRLGGHIVQGHVDGTGSIALLSPGEKWLQMDIQFPAELMKYVVPQGSICIDGVSLTVGSVQDELDQITVWLIPETLAKTNLSVKKPGDLVNIEVDVLAKYVERLTKRDN
ncbi:MAG: riboflavin synthase [Actinobacteria bacterium]|nr:riboflavin synthase [Actinomycetota bacterium]